MKIRLANSYEHSAIIDLRVTEYVNAKEFTVFDWDIVKQIRGQIVIVESEQGEIISSIQMEIINSMEDLIAASHDFPPIQPKFPTLYLNKAVSKHIYKRSGLNSKLRLFALKYAIEQNAESVTGFVYENAPRKQTMVKLGYNFYLTQNRTRHLEGRQSVLFAILERNAIIKAINYLEATFN